MMPPNAYQPYGYMPTPEPPRQWPVPAARHVPLIWTITLAVVTVIAVGLIALAPYATKAAPPADGTTLYANSLAHDDNAWNLHNDTQGQCAYANGGLDATTKTFNAAEVDGPSVLSSYDPVPVCMLQQHAPADVRLSVRLLPQANLNATLQPVIFVHPDVALLFTAAGQLAVLAYDTRWLLLDNLSTNQWHTADRLSNTVVIQVRNFLYTIALNGVQIYQGALDGVTDATKSDAIALGAYTTGNGNAGEAAFADLSVTTP